MDEDLEAIEEPAHAKVGKGMDDEHSNSISQEDAPEGDEDELSDKAIKAFMDRMLSKVSKTIKAAARSQEPEADVS